MSNIADQARTYLGVPWRHRGRTRKGMDCGGLPSRVYADLGDPRPDLVRYGRDPFNDGLMRVLTDALGAPVWQGGKGSCHREILKVGDVVVMSPGPLPRHVAIVGDDSMYGLSLIHADGTIGTQRVVEEGLEVGALEKIVAVFRRPIA